MEFHIIYIFDKRFFMNGTLNKVMLIGNVGADIKVHQFDNYDKIARFTLATSEVFTSRESGEKSTQTEWHNVVVRGNKLVEVFEKYVKKGDKLYVEGKLKTRKYVDNSGIEKYTTEIVLQEFTFLSPKGSGGMSEKESTQDDSQISTENDKDDLPF